MKIFEMDVYNEGALANKAHQIIYKHLSERFGSFSSENKNRFKDEVAHLYSEAIENIVENSVFFKIG